MPRRVFRNANLAECPDKAATDALNVCIGDLHGNAMKLLYILVEEGFLTIPKAVYADLFAIYNQREVTLQSFGRFASHLETLVVDNTRSLVLIGDELADRGMNDWYTLQILNLLHVYEVDLTILLSNHGVEFLKQVESETFGFTAHLGLKEAHSLNQLSLVLDMDIMTEASLRHLIRTCYIPKLRAIHYTVSRDMRELDIMTHAPIGLETIEAIARGFSLRYEDRTVESLMKSIDRINTRIQERLHLGNLSLAMSHPAPLGKALGGHVLTCYPLYRLIWNRVLGPELRVQPSGSFKVHFVHGHIGQQESTHSTHLNTDCDFGKYHRGWIMLGRDYGVLNERAYIPARGDDLSSREICYHCIVVSTGLSPFRLERLGLHQEEIRLKYYLDIFLDKLPFLYTASMEEVSEDTWALFQTFLELDPSFERIELLPVWIVFQALIRMRTHEYILCKGPPPMLILSQLEQYFLRMLLRSPEPLKSGVSVLPPYESHETNPVFQAWRLYMKGFIHQRLGGEENLSIMFKQFQSAHEKGSVIASMELVLYYLSRADTDSEEGRSLFAQAADYVQQTWFRDPAPPVLNLWRYINSKNFGECKKLLQWRRDSEIVLILEGVLVQCPKENIALYMLGFIAEEQLDGGIEAIKTSLGFYNRIDWSTLPFAERGERYVALGERCQHMIEALPADPSPETLLLKEALCAQLMDCYETAGRGNHKKALWFLIACYQSDRYGARELGKAIVCCERMLAMEDNPSLLSGIEITMVALKATIVAQEALGVSEKEVRQLRLDKARVEAQNRVLYEQIGLMRRQDSLESKWGSFFTEKADDAASSVLAMGVVGYCMGSKS